MFDLKVVYKRAMGGWMVQFQQSGQWYVFTKRKGYWRPKYSVAVRQ